MSCSVFASRIIMWVFSDLGQHRGLACVQCGATGPGVCSVWCNWTWRVLSVVQLDLACAAAGPAGEYCSPQCYVTSVQRRIIMSVACSSSSPKIYECEIALERYQIMKENDKIS